MRYNSKATGRNVLLAPLSGIVTPLADVPDPTFSQKMLGDGVAIDPTEETLYAPCPGTVTQLHKACHALTITTPDGIEVLLHIGLDTVLLKGKGFTPLIREGDSVESGTPLISFDADFVVRNAVSLLTLMVITGGGNVVGGPLAAGQATGGETPVLEVSPEQTSAAGTGGGDVRMSSPIVIRNPVGIHARPAATLVNSAKQFIAGIKLIKNGKEANAKSVVSIMALEVENGDTITVAAEGSDAEAALAKLVPLIESGLGEDLSGAPPPVPSAPAPAPARPVSSDPAILLGVSASPGEVTGAIFQLRHAEVAVDEKGRGTERERAALLAALDAAKKELADLQNSLRSGSDTAKAAIFAAHLELIEDPELIDAAQEGIARGESAAFAWKAAFTGQADTLARLNNELLAGRANDIRDIGRRVLLLLTGEGRKDIAIPPDAILIAKDLTPSDTAGLDKSKVRGFATTMGSATSHVAILARAASIPAVAAIEERALDIPDGSIVILDGGKGQLRLNPTQEEIERIRELQAALSLRKKAELSEAGKPATTLDGHTVKVVGNISGAAEAEEIPQLGGEGVGLLRSEFLFLQRTEAPSEEEQAAVYVAIARLLGKERDLIVRTLDVGGDKPLSYFPLPPEENPFLGVRGIRLNLVDKGLLTSQVRAILAAAPYAKLHIMFPMVATIEELREGREVVLREKEAMGVRDEVKIGIMVEVPSAAVLAESLAREADFFSIGTNDLTQYTLAVDRGHPRLAKMADALHPAVLNLIAQTARGAHENGKWVGVCGGLASDSLAVPALLGLGIDELSVTVSAIPSIKAVVRRQRLSDCRELAAELLAMQTAGEVRARLEKFQDDGGKP